METSKPIKILFAEDLAADAELALRVIRREGIEFDYRIVLEEVDFKRELTSFNPDIIVSDYSMPAFDGMTALLITRAHSAFLPFIVLTGSMNEETAVACMKAGANDYVIKEQIKRLPFAILEAIEKGHDRREKEYMQQMLRESENKFRSVLQSANDAIISFKIEGTVVGWNSGAEKMFGYTETEMLGRSVLQIMPESVQQNHLIWMRNAVDDGLTAFQTNTIEMEGMDHNNRVFPIEISMANWESSGEMFFTAIIRDITERKKAEQTLKESEQRFRMIFDNISNIAVQGYLADGTIIFWNKACELLYGYTAAEAIGNNVFNILISKKYAKQVRSETEHMFSTQQTIHSEERELLQKNGSKVHGFSSYTLVSIPDNHVELYSIDVDLTQRKNAEQQLRLLSRSVEQSPVSIVITDRAGNIEYVNSTFTKITGYSFQEAIGNNPRILKSGNQDESVYRVLWNNISAGKEWKGELLNKTKSGKLIWEDVIISPVTDDFGIITHFVAIKEDITEKKKIIEELMYAKEKAEESDRLKSAFLANMSHEIRTPMNGILGFTELLNDPNFSGEEKQNFINIIQKSGQRMLNTVNDLIDISKIETGQMAVVLSETNVKEQLLNMYCFFEPEAVEKKLKFILNNNLDDGNALVVTDAVKLDSILTNLIKNAIKYTDTGKIEIGCNCKNHEIEFYVKDTGIGIPKYRQNAVFNRFEQADVGDKRAYQGSGLGLAIAKAYVEMLEGRMELESEPGYGSTFRFFIPLKKTGDEVQVNLAEVVKDEIIENQVHKLKIIIAEDDPIGFEYLSAILNDLKCELYHAANGAEVVELFNEKPDTDLILMDIRMPLMDGYQATRKIRETNTKVHIIAQTAFALAGDREKAMAAGCNDYITKPINKKVLLQKINEFILQNKG